MPDTDHFLCATCGWTGNREQTVELDDAVECPICAELLEQGREKETTAESNLILCPVCGWSGEQDNLEPLGEENRCPICAETIEFVE
jgi:predicted RNA-binding Zn-ribbon protein involved in translation (DUF1610 family)